MKKKLYIVRGLPGSGKSTFCHNRFNGVFHVENDQFLIRGGEYRFSAEMRDKAISLCLMTIEAMMHLGIDVCVSNTFVKLEHMDAVIRLADKFGYDFSVYRMMGEYGSIHAVPEDVMNKMKSEFEDFPGEILVWKGTAEL